MRTARLAAVLAAAACLACTPILLDAIGDDGPLVDPCAFCASSEHTAPHCPRVNAGARATARHHVTAGEPIDPDLARSLFARGTDSILGGLAIENLSNNNEIHAIAQCKFANRPRARARAARPRSID